MNTEKDDSILLSTIEDKMNRCRQKDIPTFTNFLDMRQVALAQVHFRNTEIILTGGYEDAERRIALFLPDWLLTSSEPNEPSNEDPIQAIDSDSDQFSDEKPNQTSGKKASQRNAHDAAIESYLNSADSPLCILRVSTGTHHEQSRAISHPMQSRPLTHRDYLGALTGLGVDRSICGDILVRSDGADLIILQSMADYLLQNYVQAGRTALSGEIHPLSELRQSETHTEQKHDTVASLRLDCCIASVFNMSRSKAQEFIGAGLVAVNNLLTDKADRTIDEGDKLTLRGQGKAKLISIGSPTRKDRLPVTWVKYL